MPRHRTCTCRCTPDGRGDPRGAGRTRRACGPRSPVLFRVVFFRPTHRRGNTLAARPRIRPGPGARGRRAGARRASSRMKGRVGRVRRRLQWRCPWEHQLRWAAGRALRSNPITCRDSAKQRALPLRLRTAGRAEQQAWGSLALLRAGLESARAAPPKEIFRGDASERVSLRILHSASGKTLAYWLVSFCSGSWCPSRRVTQHSCDQRA